MTTLTPIAARSLKAFCIGVSTHILTKWVFFILAHAQASRGVVVACTFLVGGVITLSLLYSVATGILARWDTRLVWWWVVPALWILGGFLYSLVIGLSQMFS